MVAEYIALARAVQEMLWLRKFTIEISHFSSTPRVYCDNRSAVDFSVNHDLSERSKHIDIFVRDHLQRGAFELSHARSSSMIADLLTKPLVLINHERLSLILLNGLVGSELQEEFVGKKLRCV